MATGNFVSTAGEASDELYDFCCSVCAQNSITKEARTYCKDCAEYLCEECLKHHNRFTKMRSHVITDTYGQASDSRMPMTVSKTDLPKCGVHHGNILTSMCLQHDEFCCQSCIALKHRSCSSRIELTQAAKNIKNSHDYQRKVSAVTEVLRSLQEEKRYNQNVLTRFESERENVFENIKKYQEKLHAQIDEIAQKTKHNISITYKISETKVGTIISTLSTVIASTEQTLQNMTSENDVMSLFHIKSCQNVVHECQELLREMRYQADLATLNFRLNTDILSNLGRHKTLLVEEKLEDNREIQEKTFADITIKKMDDNQMIEVQTIAKEFNLEMNFQPDKGCLKICGMSANVISASDKIHRIMRGATKLEQEKNFAALWPSLVQWFFIEITETEQVLEKYEKDLNYKIETAYQSQAPSVKFTTNKENYILDFTKMVEYAEDDPTDFVTVIRRDLVKQKRFEQPSNWADMPRVFNLRIVALQKTEKEYQDIATRFSASIGSGVAVTWIDRIQNKTLWEQYQAKKKQLDGQNPKNTQNENFLWHGTASEAVDNINFHGFNRSYCGTIATAYGDGVYFAVNASYSALDTYSRPDCSGTKKMYYSRVLTGVYTQGAIGMRVPPSKSGPGSTDLYDSTIREVPECTSFFTTIRPIRNILLPSKKLERG